MATGTVKELEGEESPFERRLRELAATTCASRCAEWIRAFEDWFLQSHPRSGSTPYYHADCFRVADVLARPHSEERWELCVTHHYFTGECIGSSCRRRCSGA